MMVVTIPLLTMLGTGVPTAGARPSAAPNLHPPHSAAHAALATGQLFILSRALRGSALFASAASVRDARTGKPAQVTPVVLGDIAPGVPQTQPGLHSPARAARPSAMHGAGSYLAATGHVIGDCAHGTGTRQTPRKDGPAGRGQPSTPARPRPRIALTFDDGPWPHDTSAVLAVLHRYRIHATFFVIGRQAATYPGLVRAEARAGEEVEDHTWDHPDLRWLSTAAMTREISATATLVQHLTGVAPLFLRPPYGHVDARVRRVAAALGERVVLWNVDPRDWTRPGVGYIEQTVLAKARDGAIVELHDGGGVRDETVSALTVIIPTLQARGYRFVTLAQLLGGARPRERRRGRAVAP
jgi:peptidoglycan/xylan/chitin deacetylase (PgdA/CDA1 family)